MFYTFENILWVREYFAFFGIFYKLSKKNTDLF